MKQCPCCGRENLDHIKYCPVCHYWMGNVEVMPEENSYSHPEKPQVECPYCHSTNTKKITNTSRWISAGLFGIGSSKVGKQWHCNKCGSDF